MLQNTVWLMTLIGMGFVTAVYLYVFMRSTQPADSDAVKKRLYGIRPWWFVLLVGIIIVALSITLGRLPYADTHARAATAPDMTVEVTGYQWYWIVSESTLPVGTDIAFQVRAEDVNHSFALYDDNDQLLVQTQAMPGYTNIVRHTFEQPGTYRIMCLEYCGLAHHAMVTELTVTGTDNEQGERR
ncbi:MAG: hypothetical protein HND55_06125 [Pseudomonadota bacterium]|nr:MAG: hypothetical protein HND55_06125 [Pseudomonadota bacterium]